METRVTLINLISLSSKLRYREFKENYVLNIGGSILPQVTDAAFLTCISVPTDRHPNPQRSC